jgi:hypothetical protein
MFTQVNVDKENIPKSKAVKCTGSNLPVIDEPPVCRCAFRHAYFFYSCNVQLFLFQTYSKE